MIDMPAYTADALARIKAAAPLVHNITNLVVMNSSANILLAMGASPVMAHSPDEVEEMTAMAGALVLNIGTLQEDWVASMIRAGRAANATGIPVVLDPVGAGATRYRNRAVNRIMAGCRIAVLRGNASEVLSLASDAVKTRGVDSSVALTEAVVPTAMAMARDMNCVIAVSGEEDCITDGERLFRVANGQPIMTRVTGIGCGLSAVAGAFCAVDPASPLEAVTAAFAFYGCCADLAVASSALPGSFYVAFLDRLYDVGRAHLTAGLKIRTEG
jgi:hydroxyethylthiazole kinase